MMILRRFLYLDTEIVNDYLAQAEGSIITDEFEQTDTEKDSKGGKAGVSKFVTLEGSADTEVSRETKQKRLMTDPAKFQRLYELLNKYEAVQQLDAFDPGIWNQFRRGEVLEIEARLRVPSIFLVSEVVDIATPMAELMALFGSNPLADPTTKQQLEAAGSFAQLLANEPVPLLFEAVSTSKFGFAAHLARKHLRCKTSELQGEAVVFGKIQRIVAPKDKYEFSLMQSSLSSVIAPQNREQRRRNKHVKQEKQTNEVIRGPAVLIEPIAVYR